MPKARPVREKAFVAGPDTEAVSAVAPERDGLVPYSTVRVADDPLPREKTHACSVATVYPTSSAAAASAAAGLAWISIAPQSTAEPTTRGLPR